MAYMLCAWTNMQWNHPVLAVTQVKVNSLNIYADLYDHVNIIPSSKRWRTGEHVLLILSYIKNINHKKIFFKSYFLFNQTALPCICYLMCLMCFSQIHLLSQSIIWEKWIWGIWIFKWAVTEGAGWGGCGSDRRAVVQGLEASPCSISDAAVNMSKCPWAIHWTLNCS